MRKVLNEITAQRQQLLTMRDSARVTARESQKRTNELTSLRQKIVSLTSAFNTVSAERDSLKVQQNAAEARIEHLSQRLAEQEALVARLRDDLVSSQQMRWKMIRRTHEDVARNLMINSYLERPLQGRRNVLSLEDSPQKSVRMPSEPLSEPRPEQKQPVPDETDTAPLPVEDEQDNHSDSSESVDLLSIHPDIIIPQQLEAFEHPPDFSGIGTAALPLDQRRSPKTVLLQHNTDVSLALNRAPWAESLNPNVTGISSASSLVNAIKSVPSTHSGLLKLRSMAEQRQAKN